MLALSQLKLQADNIQPLWGPDPSSPTKRSIFGVALYPSSAVEVHAVWGLAQAKVFTVMRQDACVTTDSSAYFSSDETGVRCVLRIGFAFPHQEAVLKIGIGGS